MKFPVLIPNIFDHPFTYTSDINLKVGDYVEVPFGKKKVNGIVWNEFEQDQSKRFKLKKILRKLDVNPLKKTTIDFLNWFSKYNIVPKGMALKLHLLSNQAIENKTSDNFTEYNSIIKKSIYKLNDEQRKCFTNLSKKNNKFCVNVLQGTTGSGKTLVYFNLIKNKIKQNKQALILLPEIGLTGEFEKKFLDFFGFKPAIWHSSVTPKNKKIIWNGLSNGNIKAIIGARSSLFLPFKNLGIVIVDEEHDQSFKQDEGVAYNARDMAISRASYENIPVNLISAVPSVETYNKLKPMSPMSLDTLNTIWVLSKSASTPAPSMFALAYPTWISAKSLLIPNIIPSHVFPSLFQSFDPIILPLPKFKAIRPAVTEAKLIILVVAVAVCTPKVASPPPKL